MIRTSELTVPWLITIPDNWSVVRSKRIFKARKERARSEDQQLSATQAFGVIPQKEFEQRVGRRVVHINQHLDKRAHVERDDFVISMRSFQGGLERAWSSGCIRSSYVVLKPSAEIHIGYFAHLFKSAEYIRALQSTSSFIRDGQDLNFANFSLVDLPLPPIEEQRVISKFLDQISRQINVYITAKRKVSALLKEQMQAIIRQAVTRGLDSNTPFKRSGVPWIGEIPVHWTLSRVKDEFTCLNPRRVPLSAVERGRMTEPSYDYYGASGVIDKVDDYLFDDDLLLIAEDGANLVLRNLPLAVIARGKFWVNNHAHILKPKRGNLEYLAGYMETINYQPWVSGAAQPKLTKDRLMSITVAVAPQYEQDAIVQAFVEQTKPLRLAIERTQREIALMLEYRNRLTSDVVTGRLDVREAAADLPESPCDQHLTAVEFGIDVETSGLEDEVGDE